MTTEGLKVGDKVAWRGRSVMTESGARAKVGTVAAIWKSGVLVTDDGTKFNANGKLRTTSDWDWAELIPIAEANQIVRHHLNHRAMREAFSNLHERIHRLRFNGGPSQMPAETKAELLALVEAIPVIED